MNEIVTPAEFRDICPYSDSEFQAHMKALVNEDGFKHAVLSIMPDVNFNEFKKGLLAITNKTDFQEQVMFPFMEMLAARTTDGISGDGWDNIDHNTSYTMITNHRDIVLDASFLNLNLMRNNYHTTEIAIGNNLLIYQWIEDLVRLNKSIIVKRDTGMRHALEAAIQLSGYIHFAITQKHESVWIAQRQGRAKDSSDETQESLVKMLGIAGGGNFLDNIRELNLMPVSISYEFDPNDYLKVREFLLKKKNPDYKKTQSDDLVSMETGLLHKKGRVHFEFCPTVNNKLHELEGMKKNEQINHICRIIDHAIHVNYRIYPCNYIAFDKRNGTDRFVGEYNDAEIDRFEQYIKHQLEKINDKIDFKITEDDRKYMYDMILLMYSYPLVNKLSATQSV